MMVATPAGRIGPNRIVQRLPVGKALMRRHAIAALVLTAASACSRGSSPPESTANAPGPPDRSVRPIENYHNGLDDNARRDFYHLSEGGEDTICYAGVKL